MSLVARHLEAQGLPTLCLGSAFDILQAGRPPRATFVDYPLGHSAGKPFDPADQLTIVRAALQVFEVASAPGAIAHLPNTWSLDQRWRVNAMPVTGGDTRMPRDTSPQYQTEDDRRLAEAAQAGAER